MAKLKKELELIKDRMGVAQANRIGMLTIEVDKMPIQCCAASVTPKIIYDRTLMKHSLRKRVFIIVHEYMHLTGEHGIKGGLWMHERLLRHIPPKKRKMLLLWSLEIWTNIKTYMCLGYKPTDLKIDELDLRVVSRDTVHERLWILHKVRDLWNHQDEVNRICKLMEMKYHP